jgi:hypothetical protein
VASSCFTNGGLRWWLIDGAAASVSALAVAVAVVSNRLRIDSIGAAEVLGYSDATNGRIVTKHGQLRTLPKYAGTPVHEVAHATSGAVEVSAEFEVALTKTLSAVAARSQRV